MCSKTVMPNTVETTTLDPIIEVDKTEIVKPGWNYCNVLFHPTKRAESMPEINSVGCGRTRICQPLAKEGPYSKIGYSFCFLVFVFTFFIPLLQLHTYECLQVKEK